MFVLVGFAFKVSAVPFHTWAPDTYEGAPTPITAFLSVASKAAGFVALLRADLRRLLGRDDVCGPLFWVLAALTMTVGNLIALRQTNIVRLLAYSSVAQAGFMLAPLAVAGDEPGGSATTPSSAVVTYLLIYAAMNLGRLRRGHRRGPQDPLGRDRLVRRAVRVRARASPCCMTVFLFALAGIPPLGGWFAKFVVFRASCSTPGRRRRRPCSASSSP